MDGCKPCPQVPHATVIAHRSFTLSSKSTFLCFLCSPRASSAFSHYRAFALATSSFYLLLLVLLCLSLTFSNSERTWHLFCIMKPVYFIHSTRNNRKLRSLDVKPWKKVNVLCFASHHEHGHYSVPF